MIDDSKRKEVKDFLYDRRKPANARTIKKAIFPDNNINDVYRFLDQMVENKSILKTACAYKSAKLRPIKHRAKTRKDLPGLIHAALSVSDVPLSLSEICEILPDVPYGTVAVCLSRMTIKKIIVNAAGGGYRLTEFDDHAARINESISGVSIERPNKQELIDVWYDGFKAGRGI